MERELVKETQAVIEEGIAAIALGLGKTVLDGESALRFSPRYPQINPQHSKVGDILKYSQKQFYALKMKLPIG
jgi:hypothetical protein